MQFLRAYVEVYEGQFGGNVSSDEITPLDGKKVRCVRTIVRRMYDCRELRRNCDVNIFMSSYEKGATRVLV